MPLPVELGTKAPGQLIKSEDWNALVAGVNAIEVALNARITALEVALNTRITTLEGTVAALNTRVTTAETSITGLRTDVDAILANTYRVTMETSTTNYALGEMAQLTARVRDAQNNVPAPVNGERPWIDFVATWGQLKPEPGFTSRAGVAARSISVQTNAEGIARARLSSELVHDTGDDLELEFAGVLETAIGPQNRSFKQIIMESNTPSDAPVIQAYKFMQNSYDNPQGGAVRDYADSYYVHNSAKLSGKVSATITNQWRQRWRDHHVTVLAFGKSDSNPRTPDAARGANAIQVTFRDWLGPWMIIDYLPGFQNFVPGLVNIFQGALTFEYNQSANQMKNLVQQRVLGMGILGKTREYEAMRGAIDEVNPSQQRNFLPQLKESMKSAFTLQQSFIQSQALTPGGGSEEVALQAFTSTAVRADSQVEDVNEQVRTVKQQVADVQRNVSALGGRLDSTTAAGGQIEQLRAGLNLVSDQVQGLRVLGDPSRVSERINFIDSLNNRLERIERGNP